MDTRLPDGRPSLLIDPGSRGNLAGDGWVKEVMQWLSQHCDKTTLEKLKSTKREESLNVVGVGHGSQQCKYDVHVPIAMRKVGAAKPATGTFTTPVIPDSPLPPL